MITVVLSFATCLAFFSFIGILSVRRHAPTSEDYLVASRSVPAWLTALSAVATNNSGFMFVGLLGFTYRFGVQAVWLQLGWVVGDIVCWTFINRRVREVSGETRACSVPQLVATDDRGRTSRMVAVVAGVLTFFFLAGYAAAQLNAGSTALQVLFGWPAWLGAVIGAVIVVAYCFAGGLRASIWTDAAQAFVMLGSMTALMIYAVIEVGGPGQLWTSLTALDPSLVQWFPDSLALGFGLYLIGFIFGGLGAIGQPHIVIRTMAIQSAQAIARARAIYFAWYVPFSVAVVAVGLYGRVIAPDLIAGLPVAEAASAAELALPTVATAILPSVLIGMLLAGLFAATMSTADSQILSCSAAITQDIAPRLSGSYLAGKLATLSITALALAVAILASDSVFALVLGAWSALGASLGPLVILRAFRQPVEPAVAVMMMVVGVVTVTAWDHSSLAGDVFKLAPGMAAAFSAYAASRVAGRMSVRVGAQLGAGRE